MYWNILTSANLAKGDVAAAKAQNILPISHPGNSNAHVWQVTVMDGDEPADLTGATVAAYIKRADGVTVILPGTVDGNVASVTFQAVAYDVPGLTKATMELYVAGQYSMTIGSITFVVQETMTENVIDPDSVVATTVEALVTEAMDELSEDVNSGLAQINGLVQSIRGTYQGTTLFDRADGTDATALNTAYALADNYTNYDWLEVHLDVNKFSGNGNEQSHDVIHLDVPDIVADGGKATLKTIDAYDKEGVPSTEGSSSADATIMWVDIRLTFSGSTFLVRQATRKHWTGNQTNSAVAQTGRLSAAEGTVLDFDFIRLNRIIGFKRTEDAELADARIGYDGTVYQTAGAAIRGQIEQAMDSVTVEVSGTTMVFTANN